MRFTMILVFLVISALGLNAIAGTEPSMSEKFSNLPVSFIENQGQVKEEVAYYIQGADKTLYFTSQGITCTLRGNGKEGSDNWTVKTRFVGANPAVAIQGEKKQKAVYSYFKGNREDWKSAIPLYSRLVYKELWPGIDLVYHGTSNQMKYEFIVKPGADPDRIRLEVSGATKLLVENTGELKLVTPVGDLRDGKPYAYQTLAKEKEEVSMHYALKEKDEKGNTCYGFKVGPYDEERILVLDPAVFIYCGFIGGIYWDEVYGLAVDSAGCAYMAGSTVNSELTFPATVGPDTTINGDKDAFVAKVSADGSTLIYCGFIGGSGWDEGTDIAVDGDGCAYIHGTTLTDESTFPVTIGPDLTYNGDQDTFVAKVNAGGTGLVYCGYLGGAGRDYAAGIAVDKYDRAHLVGGTQSSQSTFPVSVGPDLTFNGDEDGYLAKVNANGTGLDFCGYMGGSAEDQIDDIAVDDDLNIYVSGSTQSSQSTFPVKKGPYLTHSGGHFDAFVAKLKGNGLYVHYCGYIGGSDTDWGKSIAVDADGAVYVAGRTKSTESSFPVRIGPDLTYSADGDGYVAKVNADGYSLDFCGYIGGAGEEFIEDIAVDPRGRVLVAGGTGSYENSFPVKNWPDTSYGGGAYDAFVAGLALDGSGLDFCGYVGGASFDNARAIGTDHRGNLFIAGSTFSTESSFPSLVGPDLKHNGNVDCFVACIRYPITIYVDWTNLKGPWLGTPAYPYATIQDGMDGAMDEDTVRVLPGYYNEKINFLGKAIRVESYKGPTATTISRIGKGSTVTFANGEGPDSVIEGFTITNGNGNYISPYAYGGGILCHNASPTILNNVITGNTASNLKGGFGGGIACFEHASPEIRGNIIHNNYAVTAGGGIYAATTSDPVITSNILYKNSADKGGGIMCGDASPYIINNTVVNNYASTLGGGLYSIYSYPTVTNSILWKNQAGTGGTQIYMYGGDVYVNYSNVTSGWPGTNNMDQSPRFVDALHFDYHLAPDSPCIDAGFNGAYLIPDKDVDDQRRIIPGLCNMGPLPGVIAAPATVDIGADEFCDLTRGFFKEK